MFSDIFRGYKKGAFGENGLKKVFWKVLQIYRKTYVSEGFF